jgi:hypothetical protein
MGDIRPKKCDRPKELKADFSRVIWFKVADWETAEPAYLMTFCAAEAKRI